MSNWIKEYQEEVGPPFEFEQFARNATSENIWVGGKPIGIFVYTEQEDIMTIHILWIKKNHRHKFRKAAKYIASFAKDAGYKRVELITDLRVCQLIERYLKLKPVQKIYLEERERILELL